MAKTDKRFKLLTEDRKKWVENQLEFLKPLTMFIAPLYLSPILVKLQEADHIVSVSDFIPSEAVKTALAFYLVNAVYDLLRKWWAK